MTDKTGAVQGLSVTLLLAKNTQETANFYREALGLGLHEEQHDGRPPHYACQLGSVYFTIQPAGEFSKEPPSGYDFLQLCFTVADLDAFLQRLRGLNISPLHPPQPFEHTTFTTLLDPDGRHVRIMTPWGQGGHG